MSESAADLLFLIGARGVGKTTVALALADRLGWEAVDADSLLEDRFDRSIRSIFDEEGETGFRDKETLVLHDICTRTRCVVATGGGVVLREENRELLRSTFVVWLRASVETMADRLARDDSTAERRPALTAGGSSVSVEEIRQIIDSRQALYEECADFALDTDDRTASDLVELIVDHWQGRLRS